MKKEGLEGRSEAEEGGTRRKEGWGGRRDKEREKMKNEKVAKGRIIGYAGPCLRKSGSDRSTLSLALMSG